MKPSRNTDGPHRPLPTGTIRADELLPIRELHTRLGWGPRTVALAQRQGLRVLRFAKWKYLLGADVIAFLERANANGTADQQPAAEPAAAPEGRAGNE